MIEPKTGYGSPAPASAWSGRTRGGFIGNWIFVKTVKFLGLGPAYLLLVPVTLYFLLFAPRALKASAEYRLRIGLEGTNPFSRFRLAFLHFYSFGRILLDRLAIIGGDPTRFSFRFDGEEHIRGALAEGRGLIITSAHCGNWEIAAHLLKRVERPVHVVAYAGEAAFLRNYFERVFQDRAFSVLEMDGSPESSLKIFSAVRQGEVIAMHADRVQGRGGANSVSLPFLGQKASFPTGPYHMASLSGAPLIHAFAMREGRYRYRFLAYPPERLPPVGASKRQERMAEWAGLFVGRLEAVLRDYPLQWHNFYPFWSAAGPSEIG